MKKNELIVFGGQKVSLDLTQNNISEFDSVLVVKCLSHLGPIEVKLPPIAYMDNNFLTLIKIINVGDENNPKGIVVGESVVIPPHSVTIIPHVSNKINGSKKIVIKEYGEVVFLSVSEEQKNIPEWDVNSEESINKKGGGKKQRKGEFLSYLKPTSSKNIVKESVVYSSGSGKNNVVLFLDDKENTQIHIYKNTIVHLKTKIIVFERQTGKTMVAEISGIVKDEAGFSQIVKDSLTTVLTGEKTLTDNFVGGVSVNGNDLKLKCSITGSNNKISCVASTTLFELGYE